MNVYEDIPVLEGENFLLRGLLGSDAEELFKTYSDEKAVPFFNGDNCHGDNFHYTTPERMKQAVEFWLWSYAHGYFVRWAIVDKRNGAAIGTVELFHRDDESEAYANGGLLRLDVRSDYEEQESIQEILSLIIDPAFDLFYCDKIITKVWRYAGERLKAVAALGFLRPAEPLRGNGGEEFDDYFILYK